MNNQFVLLSDLIMLDDSGVDMRPLASPLIPIDIFIDKRLGVIPNAFNRGAVRCGWAGPPTT